MRIISKFKDYYDVGMSYGADPTLVYPRETQIFDSEFEAGFRPHWITYLISGTLYFCGTAYPFMTESTYSPYKITKEVFPFFTTLEDVIKFDEDHPHPTRTSIITSLYTREHLSNFLKGPHEVTPDIHFQYNSPIVMYLRKEYEGFGLIANSKGRYSKRKRGFIYTNPILRTLRFQTVVDPYTAFQQISMFLGGVLGNIEKDTVKITDDKVLRDSKGFDDQSFKTGSPGKKKNRRKYK